MNSTIVGQGASALRLVMALMISLQSLPALGSTFTMRFGPAAVGGGGPNPIGIPPGPTDIEFCYLTKNQWETNIAASPGLLFGRRWSSSSGFYISSGGGIVVSRSGAGLGGYTSFGGDFGAHAIKFNADFKQALGLAGGTLVSPYALRLGVSYVF